MILPLQRNVGLSDRVAFVFSLLGVKLPYWYDYWGAMAQLFEVELRMFQEAGTAEAAIKDVGVTFNNLGVAYGYLSNFEKAHGCFKEALRVYQALELPEGEAVVHTNLGIMGDHVGNFYDAMGHLRYALKIFRSLRGPMEGVVLNSLGVLFKNLGEYRKAVAYYEGARRIFSQQTFPYEVVWLCLNIAIVTCDLGDYDTSLNYFETALELSQDLNLPIEEAIISCNFVELYLAQGKLDKAEALLEKHPDKLMLGKYYLVTKEYEQAILYLLSALETVNETRDAVSLEGCLIGLSLCNEGMGEWEKACLCFEEAVNAIEGKRQHILPHKWGLYLKGKVLGLPRLEAYRGLIRVLHHVGKEKDALAWKQYVDAIDCWRH